MGNAAPLSIERAPRTRVLLFASVQDTDGCYTVRLRNISSGGVLVEGSRAPDKGAPVIFRRNGLVTQATVAWSDGRFAGLRFLETLDPERMLRISAPVGVDEDVDMGGD